jgi:GT2 family glycosyltransferase
LVVVTHNSSEPLKELIAVLAGPNSSVFSEIVFVDNASSDQTRALITQNLPAADLLCNPVNRGFATAVNQGVKATLAPYVLLANPDVSFRGNDVEALVALLERYPHVAAVAPRLVFPDGRPQLSLRRFPNHANIWLSRQSPLRFFESLVPMSARYTMHDPKVASPVEAVAATFLLIRREAYDLVGGMDEEYFLYVEDTDLCKRWHDRGLEVWIDPSVQVPHAWQRGSSKDQILSDHHRNGIRRYFQIHHRDKPIRNSLLFGALRLAGWRTVSHESAGT